MYCMAVQFELNHLKYFYYTALEGGVMAAAKALHVQQPVVTKSIKNLEYHLGAALFQKVGRRNVLTDFGQITFRHCQVIFNELNKINHLQLNADQVRGYFGIAASEVIASDIVPKVTSLFLKTFPNVNVKVYSGIASHLLKLLSEKQLEMGLFFHIPQLAANLEICQRIPIRFKVVIKYEEKNNKSVIQSFIGSREIENTSNLKFPTVDLMRKKFPDTKITLSSNNFGFHHQMVLSGNGVSILPDYLIKDDLKHKRLFDLYPKEKFYFDLKVVRPKGVINSRLEEQFLTDLNSVIDKL